MTTHKRVVDAFETYMTAKSGERLYSWILPNKRHRPPSINVTLESKDFDVLYVPGYYEEVGLILKQARENGYHSIVGGDGLSSDS